jgi:hypothetical protein
VATPARSLIALSDDAGAGRTTLSLVTLEGSQVAHVTLPQSTYPWAAVGGDMLTFVDQNQLKGLTPSGTVETLGPITGYSGGAVVVSPDGQHWMWSTMSGTTSRLMLGGRGSPDRVIARETTEQSHLVPYRWTSAGPTYVNIPMGIGGYILFGFGGNPSWRFDAGTGQVTSLLARTSCVLGDLAQDGTIACLGTTNSTLDVVRPNGDSVEITLPRPNFTQRGAVTFAPGSTATTLVVGGAASAGPPTERYETDLLDIGSRTLKPFGPAGLRPAEGPWVWLPDGSLLSYRPARASGGDPGVYVVAPDGSARKVLSSGTALGVISG